MVSDGQKLKEIDLNGGTKRIFHKLEREMDTIGQADYRKRVNSNETMENVKIFKVEVDSLEWPQLDK